MFGGEVSAEGGDKAVETRERGFDGIRDVELPEECDNFLKHRAEVERRDGVLFDFRLEVVDFEEYFGQVGHFWERVEKQKQK